MNLLILHSYSINSTHNYSSSRMVDMLLNKAMKPKHIYVYIYRHIYTKMLIHLYIYMYMHTHTHKHIWTMKVNIPLNKEIQTVMNHSYICEKFFSCIDVYMEYLVLINIFFCIYKRTFTYWKKITVKKKKNI